MSLHLQRMANDQHLRRAFSYFDKDGNGYIEADELREALVEDGTTDGTDVVNDIFQEVDTDKVALSSYLITVHHTLTFFSLLYLSLFFFLNFHRMVRSTTTNLWQ